MFQGLAFVFFIKKPFKYLQAQKRIWHFNCYEFVLRDLNYDVVISSYLILIQEAFN